MKNKKGETHKMQHEDGVITGIVTNGALPYCAKGKEEFLEGLKVTNECEYGQNDIFVNYKGKENVFVEHHSLSNNQNNNNNNEIKRGRVIFLQHGLDGNQNEDPKNATDQYIEFETMVKKLKGQKAKNGYEFESLGIITKRQNSINKLKGKNTFIISEDKNTYIFFNDAMDKQKAEKLGMINFIYEKTKNKNILIRTEFSTGQLSFENQLNEMKSIVGILETINDKIDVTFIGHSMGGIVSINYGIDYAKSNKKKDIDIITISTPYLPNILAKGKNLIKKTDASVDLASQSTRDALKQKWDDRTKNIELCAIAVAKAGKEEASRNIIIGDGVVNLKSQLGDSFKNISSKYLVVYESKEKVGLDANDYTNNAHHSNTPDMNEVIEIIKNEVKL